MSKIPTDGASDGFVLIHRKIFESPMFEDDEPFSKREALIWMVCAAAWTDTTVRYKGALHHLKRGQLIASIRDLADRWKWNRCKVERFLRETASETAIETASETGITVITICNYDKYQSANHDRETPSETPSETASETHNNKVKKEYIYIPPIPPLFAAAGCTIDPEPVPADPPQEPAAAAPPPKPQRERKNLPRRPVPDDWTPSEADRRFATDRGIPESRIPGMAEQFRWHHVAKGTLTASVSASWRTWVLKDASYSRQATSPPGRREQRSKVAEVMRLYEEDENGKHGFGEKNHRNEVEGMSRDLSVVWRAFG